MSPSIPAVFRVMTGWFCAGIGALNLAVESDGGLTPAYAVFHGALLLGGMVLLSRRRLVPSRAGAVLGGGLLAGAMALGLLVMRGYPYPLDGPKSLVIDVIFWGCTGLLVLTVIAGTEARLPERRTPVDLARYSGHAEPGNVGGLP